MPIRIFEQRVDPFCGTPELHNAWRHDLVSNYNKTKALKVLEQVVCGNTVVEIGCGVFGGIAEVILKYPFESYTGIDRSIGDANWQEYPSDMYRGDVNYSRRVPAQITISDFLLSDLRVNFLFGIDAYSYLKDLKNDSVVTVSTGFFHDKLLILEEANKDYVSKMIKEICRVTKRGNFVGLHQFILDGEDNCHEGELRFGYFFKQVFRENGIVIHPVDVRKLGEFCYFEK